jgi:hypothetical protein
MGWPSSFPTPDEFEEHKPQLEMFDDMMPPNEKS